MYFFAKKSLSEQADVDDIVQDTFLKAMKRYNQFTFKSEGELKSWLLTICRHLIIDFIRENKKVIPLQNEDIEFFDEKGIEDLIDAEITRSKDIKKIKEELKKMKPVEQEIIRLRVVEEMEFKDIAVALGVKEAAIKMRFYRSIIKLKETLL